MIYGFKPHFKSVASGKEQLESHVGTLAVCAMSDGLLNEVIGEQE